VINAILKLEAESMAAPSAGHLHYDNVTLTFSPQNQISSSLSQDAPMISFAKIHRQILEISQKHRLRHTDGLAH